MTADQEQLTGLQTLTEAWAQYGKATQGLNVAYDEAIDAALTQLGRATTEAYADYDRSVALAWEAWQSARNEARHLRDLAVSEGLMRMEAEAKAEVRAQVHAP